MLLSTITKYSMLKIHPISDISSLNIQNIDEFTDEFLFVGYRASDTCTHLNELIFVKGFGKVLMKA